MARLRPIDCLPKVTTRWQHVKIGFMRSKRLPTWHEMNADTSPEAETILFNLLRGTPTWRKLEMLDGLNRTARHLALAGLRQRHPDASTKELRRRLANRGI